MRRIVIIAASLAVVAACVFVVLHFRDVAKHSPVPVQGLVSLSVIGFTTNSITDEEYYCALIRMTNGGTNSVSYVGSDSLNSPNYETLFHHSSGWKSIDGGEDCWICQSKGQLFPSQSTTFEAFIFDGDKPCQVTVRYWDDKGTRRLEHTAATPVFQFRKTKPRI